MEYMNFQKLQLTQSYNAHTASPRIALGKIEYFME